MATVHETKLKISTESDGGQSIKALVAELEQLAAQGGEAAPELQRLAAEIQNLERANEAVGAFSALFRATQQMGDQAAEARAKLAALSPQLADASAKTQALKQAQKDANDAFKDGSITISERRAKQAELKAALTDAKQAEKALSVEYAATERELLRLNQALDRKRAATYAAHEVAVEAGVNTRNMVQEEVRLRAALDATAQSAQRTANAFRDANRQAAQSAADDALRQQAVAAQRAAEYTRWWAESLDKAEKEAAQAAATTRALGGAINNAFAVTGVRSANAIQAEINEINQALMRLATNTRTTGAEFDRAWSAGQKKIAALEAELSGVDAAQGRVTKSTNAVSASMKQLAAAYGGLELARQFITANVELERNERVLKSLTGSAAAAAREMAFIRETADRLGVSVNDVAQQYNSLLAASNNTSLAGEKIRGIFASVANALGQVGASSYATSRAFTAITQMVSKGVVSMEEMRQQLGEALPGAFTAAARGIGITEAELMKLIGSGQLLTEHFLPAFKQGLDETFVSGGDRIEGFQQSWNRLKQAMTDTSTFVGQSGFMAGLATMAEGAAKALKLLTFGFTALGRQAGLTLSFIFDSSTWTRPIQSMKLFGQAQRELLEDLREMYHGTAAGSDAVAASAKRAGDTVAASAPQVRNLAEAQKLLGKSAGESAMAQLAASRAAVDAALSAESTTTNWSKVTVQYGKAQESAEAVAAASQKIAEAKKVEGEAASRITAIMGSESEARRVSAENAAAYAQALRAVSDANAQSVKLLESEIEIKSRLGSLNGTLTAQEQAAVNSLRDKLALKQAELEKSQQLSSQAAIEAAQARVLAQTYVDNSARLAEYTREMVAATTALQRIEMQHANGVASQEALTQARVRAAQALALYRDAIGDTVTEMAREGELNNRLAQLAGNEIVTRQTAAKSAQNNAQALAEANAARRQEVAAIQDQIAKLNALEAASGTLSAEAVAYREQLRQTLAMREQEIAQSERVTTSARLEAEQQRVKAESYKDNAARISEYAAQVAAAEAAVNRLTAAHEAGRATEAQVAEARIKHAGALALYRDALKDATEAAERKIKSIQSEVSVTQAMLQLEMERAKTAEKAALAQGNERAAIEAKVRMKEIEIRMVRANMEASALEAKAIEATVEAERKEAEATGTLTEAKKAELEARLAAAKVKALEAERGAELIKQLEAEADAIRNVNSAKNSSKGSSGSGSSSSGGSEQVGTPDGGIQVGIDFERELFAMGASVDEARAAMQYVQDYFRKQMVDEPIRDWYKSGYTIDRNIREASAKALRRAKQETNASDPDRGSVSGGQGALLQQNPLTRRPVTINIGGDSHTMNVADDGDVSTLERILRRLGTDKKRF